MLATSLASVSVKRPQVNEMVCRIIKQDVQCPSLASICAGFYTLTYLHMPYLYIIPTLTHTKGLQGQVLEKKNTEKAEALKPKAGNKNSAVTWRNKQVFPLSAKHGVAVI